jgi:hypothetical protein
MRPTSYEVALDILRWHTAVVSPPAYFWSHSSLAQTGRLLPSASVNNNWYSRNNSSKKYTKIYTAKIQKSMKTIFGTDRLEISEDKPGNR